MAGQAVAVSPPTQDDGYARVPEAQAYLGLSRATIYVLMDRGEIAYARFGRARRIPRRALREYAERCMVPAAAGL